TPTLTSTSPHPPSANSSPKVVGHAQAGTTVRLYLTANCSGSPDASGTAAQLASPGITASVPANKTSVFHATATNNAGTRSACSGGLAYTNDTLPPPAPTITGTSPASGAADTTPDVQGTAESGSTVKLFTNAG